MIERYKYRYINPYGQRFVLLVHRPVKTVPSRKDVPHRVAVGWSHTSSGQRRLATFAAKGRCTRCTCLACTSTCASRGDFPYKSPEIRLISVDSARLVHRITVPLKFPLTNQTCTTSAQLPHKVRATHRPHWSIGGSHAKDGQPGLRGWPR